MRLSSVVDEAAVIGSCTLARPSIGMRCVRGSRSSAGAAQECRSCLPTNLLAGSRAVTHAAASLAQQLKQSVTASVARSPSHIGVPPCTPCTAPLLRRARLACTLASSSLGGRRAVHERLKCMAHKLVCTGKAQVTCRLTRVEVRMSTQPERHRAGCRSAPHRETTATSKRQQLKLASPRLRALKSAGARSRRTRQCAFPPHGRLREEVRRSPQRAGSSLQHMRCGGPCGQRTWPRAGLWPRLRRPLRPHVASHSCHPHATLPPVSKAWPTP